MAEPIDPSRHQPEASEYDLIEPVLPKAVAPDDDDEPIVPARPKPAAPAYLPRLWKTAEDPEPEEKAKPAAEPEPPKARPRKKIRSKPVPKIEAKPKKGADEAGEEGAEGKKLVEETPALDTVEARQRARWIVGVVAGAIGLLSLVFIFRAFDSGPAEEIRGDEPAPKFEPRAAVDTKAAAELEAQNLLNNARRAALAGKVDAARNSLVNLIKSYPGTAAAREATAALDRDKHNNPLFEPAAPDKAKVTKAPGDGSGKAMPTGPAPPPPSAGPPPPAVARADATPTAPRPVDPNASPGPTATTPKPPTVPTAPLVTYRPLPRGFRIKADSPIHQSGWPIRIISERDEAEMVLVPASTFNMGREDGEADERPIHRVQLSTYYIDVHEVTVRSFRNFLKETGRPLEIERFKARVGADPSTTDEHPVANITAREASEYCAWARRQLPTEAQWELAARSPEGRISYWNGELPRKDPAKGPRLLEPVMSLPSDLSPYGAFDLGANAWEWTADFYDSQYYKQNRGLSVDPTGPKESPSRPSISIRGGSPTGILTWRAGVSPASRLPYLGFRGALTVETTVDPAAPKANPGAPTGGVQPF